MSETQREKCIYQNKDASRENGPRIQPGPPVTTKPCQLSRSQQERAREGGGSATLVATGFRAINAQNRSVSVVLIIGIWLLNSSRVNWFLDNTTNTRMRLSSHAAEYSHIVQCAASTTTKAACREVSQCPVGERGSQLTSRGTRRRRRCGRDGSNEND